MAITKWYLLQASKLQEDRGGQTKWDILHQGKPDTIISKIMKTGTEKFVYCIQYQQNNGALIQLCQIGYFDYEKRQLMKDKRKAEALTELTNAVQKIMRR